MSEHKNTTRRSTAFIAQALCVALFLAGLMRPDSPSENAGPAAWTESSSHDPCASASTEALLRELAVPIHEAASLLLSAEEGEEKGEEEEASQVALLLTDVFSLSALRPSSRSTQVEESTRHESKQRASFARGPPLA